MSYDEKSRKRDNIARGIKEPSPLGTGLFVGLRALDPVLQYGILARGIGSGLIAKLGGTTLAQGPALITNTVLDRLALSPYRSILLAMAVGSAVKQIYNILALSEETMPPGFAVVVSAGNAVANSINSLLFVCAFTSASVNGESFPQTPLLAGAGLYTVGILTESISEWQRRNFKRDPANKRNVYEGGLFSLSRHVNYFGYTMWRAGYALAAGGWTWAAVVASLATWDFTTRAIPVLNHYCQERYGEQWEHYKRQTPYQFVPYLY